MQTDTDNATDKQEVNPRPDVPTMEEYAEWLREFLMRLSPEYASHIASTRKE